MRGVWGIRLSGQIEDRSGVWSGVWSGVECAWLAGNGRESNVDASREKEMAAPHASIVSPFLLFPSSERHTYALSSLCAPVLLTFNASPLPCKG